MPVRAEEHPQSGRARLVTAVALALLAAAPAPGQSDPYDVYDVCLRSQVNAEDYLKLNLATGVWELCCGGRWEAGGVATLDAGDLHTNFDDSSEHFRLFGHLDAAVSRPRAGGGEVTALRRVFDDQPFDTVCSFSDTNAFDNDCTGCRPKVRVANDGTVTTEKPLEIATAGSTAGLTLAAVIFDGGAGIRRLELLKFPHAAALGTAERLPLLQSPTLWGVDGMIVGDTVLVGAIDGEFQPHIFRLDLDGAPAEEITHALGAIPPLVTSLGLEPVPGGAQVSLADPSAWNIKRWFLGLGSAVVGHPLATLVAPDNYFITHGFRNGWVPQTASSPAGQVGTVFQEAQGQTFLNIFDPATGDTAVRLGNPGHRAPNALPLAPVEPAVAYNPATDEWGVAFIEPFSGDVRVQTVAGKPPHTVSIVTLAKAPIATGVASDFNQPALAAIGDGGFLAAVVSEDAGALRLWRRSREAAVHELLNSYIAERGPLHTLDLVGPPPGEPHTGVASIELLSQGSLRVTELLLDVAPPPPSGPWSTSPILPGYRFKTRIGEGASARPGKAEPCIPETVCLSGALPGRAELFLRLVGPRPNGHLWPHLVKFTSSRVQVWIEHPPSGTTRYYDLPAVVPGESRVELAGLAHKTGFLPPLAAGDAPSSNPRDAPRGEAPVILEASDGATLDALSASPAAAAGADPAPPAGPWLETPRVPGFRAKVRITAGPAVVAGARETDCIAETLCVSGALRGRSEVFIRVVGPRPNGYLWPTLVKFSSSRVEVWIERKGNGQTRYYDLAAVEAGEDLVELAGLADKLGFSP
jgi:hypothetical protein